MRDFDALSLIDEQIRLCGARQHGRATLIRLRLRIEELIAAAESVVWDGPADTSPNPSYSKLVRLRDAVQRMRGPI